MKREYTWQAAFVAFCNGVPLDEVSTIFGIPMDTLKEKMASDGWRALRAKLPLVTTSDGAMTVTDGDSALPANVATKMKLIEANRMENLKVFAELREHLVEKVRGLRDGTLMVHRQWHNKGLVTEADAPPGPGDWVNIATYARTIADGTYRALGDFQAQEKPGQDAPAGTVNAPQPAITIILPGAIAQPRDQRQIHDASQGQVIDLRPVTADSAPSNTPK